MALVGYARVSSVGQSLDVQLEKLDHCDKIFEEKASGSKDDRPQLAACLSYLREGDVLVITRLDRLARSTLHLCKIASQLESDGVALQVLDQSIDTTSATGRLLFNMLAAIAQFENELRKERQTDGINKAKARGVKFGRQPALSPEQVEELRALREQGAMIRELMEKYSISKATTYRYLAEDEDP